MSASTVSITANPAATAARRRKQGLDLLDSVAAVSPAIKPAGGGRAASGELWIERDLGNGVRGVGGETVLEKSREAVRRPLPVNGSTLPRRPAKKSSKPEKSRLQTVLSVFTKNFLLLLIILGMVQIIRRLATKPTGDSNSTISSDFEGRIAELESLVKTTTEIMQLQVDAVDRKMETGFDALREELSKKIEEKGSELGDHLKKLGGRTETLEKLLNEFKLSSNWLTKQDFERIFNEFKKASGANGDERASLDELRAVAKEIVKKEIEKHAADGLGRVDYALAAGGGEVTEHSDRYVTGKRWLSMINRNGVREDAKKMLTPSFGEPGHCFPLKGGTGFVQVKLRTAIIPEAITLEHVSKSVAYDRSSAPKDCRVSGWLKGKNVADSEDVKKVVLLTEFTYDLEKSNAQTFNVMDPAAMGPVDTIRLDFTSNHGSPSHTCIYRLRVHGFEPRSVPMLSTES